MARSGFGTTTQRVTASLTANQASFSTLTVAGWGLYTGGSTYGCIAGYGNAQGVLYIKETVSPAKIAVYLDATHKLDPGSITIPTSTWVHLAYTSTANGTTQAYVNGVADSASFASPVTFASTQIFSAGGDASGGNFLTGSVADAAVWNVILTAAELLALAKGARPSNIRPANLVVWWPLDGLQSPEPDLSGKAQNGTVGAGVTSAPGPPVAPFTPRGQPILLPVEGISGARRFNGVSDSIATSAVATNASGSTPIALSCWFYPTSSAGTQCLFFNGNSASNGFGLFSTVSGNGRLQLLSGGHNFIPATGPLVTLNAWNNIMVTTVNGWGASGQLYLNGIPTSTGAATGAVFAATTVVHIGVDSATSFFSGRIADVAIWTANLTQAEATALAQGARPVNIRPGSLVCWLPLDGLQSPEPNYYGPAGNGTVSSPLPAPGPPIAPFSPRWPQNLDIVAAPSFNPAWRVPFNQVVSGGVAT